MHAESQTPSERARAGGTVLSLIAGPSTVSVLRAHRERPLRLADLRDRIAGAGQATLRGQVEKLRGVGALVRQVRPGMPYTVENELTAAGEGILGVAEVVEAWLARAPQGPILLGSEAAKDAIRALIGGWGSAVLRALADQLLSLAELSGVVGGLSYPALGRRLAAMRSAGQIEPRPREATGVARSYGVTRWTRQAVGALVAAGRCERQHLPRVTGSLTHLDIEAALLLAVPLIRLRPHDSGSFLLAVDAAPAPHPVAGAQIEVEGGSVSARAVWAEEEPPTRAQGAVGAWIGAILDGSLDRLHFGGEQPQLAGALVEGVHRELLAA